MFGSSWPRLSTISSKTQKKHLFPRPEKLGPYEKHMIDPNKCPMTEALRKKEHSHYRMRLENLFFKTSGLGDKHRREEFPKYGNRYHNNANSSFLETGASESIETKGIRVHTGEIIFLSKSEITSEMHRQSMYRNVSLLYDTWRDDYNVTKKTMQTYWRGQSENMIEHARELAIKDWINKLKDARKKAAAYKVKNLMNMKVLRRTVNAFTADKDLAKAFIAETVGRYDGKYVNKKDEWGGRYRNTAISGGWKNDSNTDTNITSKKNTTEILLKLNKKRKMFNSIVKNDTFNILKEWAKGSMKDQPHLWANNGSLWKNFSKSLMSNRSNTISNVSHMKNASINNKNNNNNTNMNIMRFKRMEKNQQISGVITEIRDDFDNKNIVAEIRDSDDYNRYQRSNNDQLRSNQNGFKPSRRHNRNHHPIESIYLELQKDSNKRYHEIKKALKKAEKRFERMKKIHLQNRKLRGGK